MSLYRKGRISIGAVSSEMTISEYRTIADTTAKVSHAPNGVIAFRKNDANPAVFTFTLAEEANAKYDALANSPGEFVYVYLYRERLPVDEAFFTASPTHSESRKERIGTGWILGGVGLGMLGLAMGFRQKKGQ